MTADNMLLILEMKRAEIDATIVELRHVLSVLTGMDTLPALALPVPVPAAHESDPGIRLVASTPLPSQTPQPPRTRRRGDRTALHRDMLAFFDAHPEPQRLGDVFQKVLGSGQKDITVLLRAGALIKTGNTAAARFSRPPLQQDTGT